MKKIFLVFICVCVLMIPFNSYSQVSAVVSGVKAGTWASTATRMLPVLMKAGSVAKWVMAGVTPAGLALLAAGVLAEFAVNNISRLPKVKEWLEDKGYRVQDGVLQKGTYTYAYVVGSNEGNNQNSWVSWCNSAFAGWGTLNYEIYPTYTSYQARKAILLADGYTERSGLPSYTYIAVGAFEKGSVPNETMYFLSRPVSDNSNVAGSWGNYQNVSTASLISDYASSIASGESKAKAAWEEMEGGISKALAGDPGWVGLLSAKDGSGVSVRDLLNNMIGNYAPTVKASVEAEASGMEGDTDITEAITESEKAEDANKGDQTGFEDTGDAQADNEEVLSSDYFSDQKTLIESLISSALNDLQTAVMAIINALTGKMQTILAGDGVCSFALGTVYGKEATLDFCDQPYYNTIKGMVIGVGYIAVIIILIM